MHDSMRLDGTAQEKTATPKTRQLQLSTALRAKTNVNPERLQLATGV